jgi:hypothetical protein
LLDVVADGHENIAGGMTARDGERGAEVTVEVASTERDVVAVGHAKALGAEGVSQSAKDAGFPNAGLAGDDGVFLLVNALDELVNEGSLGRRQPELVVVDFLREGSGGERKVFEIEAHDASSSS